jgi:hypothetical protein
VTTKSPSWLGVALAAACGFLLGVLVVLGLDGLGGGDGVEAADVPAVTRTVTVPGALTTGGTVIVRTAVPDVVGQRLDVAEARLDRARFLPDREGGGLLGVLEEENWEVVAQDPAPGSQLEQGSTVRIEIERR